MGKLFGGVLRRRRRGNILDYLKLYSPPHSCPAEDFSCTDTGLVHREYFMVGECVRFLFTSCERSLNEQVSAANE